MRRTTTLVGVGMVLTLALALEGLAAATAPKASVTDTIKKDESITITATDCESGTNYDAYVDVHVYRPDWTAYSGVYREADVSGTTTITIQITEVGTFSVTVECIHVFDNGNKGSWYLEAETVTVTGTATITEAERQKCKNKKTRKARRKCLKKAALD